MSQERRDGAAKPAEEQVKVVDRRRFREDGEPVEAAGDPSGGEGAVPEAEALAEVPSEAAAETARRLAAQEARIDELTRAYAALVEDNKAFRQRQERERVRVVAAERAGIAQTLLEAADDLERALGSVAAADARQAAVKSLIEGVRLSLAGMHKRIADLGAERIVVHGLPFDPQVAEAVDTVAVPDASQDGRVVEEIRPGFRIGDRVLRPARVRVGRLAKA
ncbi:MAG TPA: nucleotide exchange factor GrpE [Anaeromyxobacter sp.]|nr:nucleotide exchange factor GrpE [Anaeromyxobacter sp.]